MKKIIFGAMAAAALLACSKEQVIEQNRANDEIGFSVVAENQTKAAAVYDSNNKMGGFSVAATYNNSWYFQKDTIVHQNSAWVNQTTTRYWSADGKHDFYAISNGTMTLAGPTDKPKVVDFTPATTVADQKDLLYAVAADKEKSNDPVMLNFRHALSQIEFKAKNTNSKLYVKISGVQVGQAYGKATFTYPLTSTTEEDVVGDWTDYDTPTNYTVTFSPVGVAGNNNAVGLTLSTDEDGNPTDVTNSMLLIPATTVAWIPTTDGGNNGEGTEGNIPEQGGQLPSGPEGPADEGEEGDDGGFDNNDGDDEGKMEESVPEFAMRRYNTASAGASDVTGSYLAVKCQIYNVAGTAYADTDVCIYEGWAMIPAEFEWAQGNKYIYTFVFGEGDFGYNAGNGDTPTTPDGEKVLTTMDYNVKVESFVEPDDETDMNMRR